MLPENVAQHRTQVQYNICDNKTAHTLTMFELKLRVFPNQLTHVENIISVCGKQVEINKKPLEKLEEGREDAHTTKDE